MPIYKGNKKVEAIFKGNNEIKEVFKGIDQLFVSGTAPATLTLISIRQSQVVLRVTNNDPDVVDFTEIRYASQTFTSSLTINGNGGTRDFTITGLAMTTPFSFIANVDADGKGISEDSNTISTTTLAQQTPSIESVSALNPTTIRFRLRNNNAETTTVRYAISGSNPTTSSPGVTLAAGALSSNIDVGGQPASSTRTIKSATFINNISSGVASTNVTTPMNLGPGPTTLVAGNMTAGFFGQATQTQMGITMTQVMSNLGISQGTAQFTTDGLLKFIHRGKIKFINRRTIRHTISWDHISARLVANGGNVHGGATMTFGGNSYKVRLMRGWGQVSANANGTGTPNYNTGPLMTISHAFGSGGNNGTNFPTNTSGWSENNPNEWNTLIFPIASATQSQTSGVPNWASYSNADLQIVSGNGRETWTQETRNNFTTRRMYRGGSSLAYIRDALSNTTNFVNGLRLVFELI